MPEVMPCPNPKCHGHTKGVHKEYSGGPSCHYMYSVKCCGCGISGPERREKADAIADWNTLPRALTWTHDPPKVAGWYWHHMPPAFGTVIEFFDPEISKAGCGEWAGPIAPPIS